MGVHLWCASESEVFVINRVRIGCEVLFDRLPAWFRTKRIGLLANQASVDGDFRHIGALIRAAGGNLCCLFSPQHGFDAEKQANMQESSDGWNVDLKIPVFSLYGAIRQPTAEMLEQIDVLIVDLQDVGSRVYTYGITMGLCLEMAATVGVKVVILDRPNPIGGVLIEGNLLQDEYRSFVGRYHVPMRHGLTLGELARLIVREARLDCDFSVVVMQGWQRSYLFSNTALPWVYPSPNMPTWETALTYPGMVLLEGTNISEGRGTSLPFQLFGAPFLRQSDLLARMNQYELQGVVLRPVAFEPVFDKWQGTACFGFQIHVTDHNRFQPYRFSLALLQALYHTHHQEFRWLPPPYEYEAEKLPIDIILGNRGLRQQLEAGVDIRELETSWQDDLSKYWEQCRSLLLYG
jgi:uncharacterized protein YbbC (DUF1343 family)